MQRFQDQGGAKPKELIGTVKSQELPLGSELGGEEPERAGHCCPGWPPGRRLSLKPGEKGTLSFTCSSPEGVALVKTFTFNSDSYGFDLAVKVANHTRQPLEGQLGLELSENFAG